MVERLAHVLDTAGLGGCNPERAARALLSTISAQPTGCPDHHAAHNALALSFARQRPELMREAILTGASENVMSLLARLVYAGMTESELLALIPERSV